MIKTINTSSRYLTVSGTGSSTYVNNYNGSIGVGNMRYNTSNQCMEVYDGNNWMTIAMDHASVSLTAEADSLLDWARAERDKQFKRDQLVKNNPALQKAMEAIKRAEANFDILEKFVENDSSGSSN